MYSLRVKRATVVRSATLGTSIYESLEQMCHRYAKMEFHESHLGTVVQIEILNRPARVLSLRCRALEHTGGAH